MITFRKIKIQDFKSIKYAELAYDVGVWKIVGNNNDAVFNSNGSGKTTLLEAIQQCLFNKTISGAAIEEASRRQIGTAGASSIGYRFELELSDGINDYKIINDRKLLKIQIFKDGRDMMIKSIPAALKRIQSIINMDFSTFTTLTFITHGTIVDMLDNFSSSSLMKIVLNFAQIADFERSAKSRQKLLNNSLTSLSSEIQTLTDSVAVLTRYERIDLIPLYQHKASIVAQRSGVEELEKRAQEIKDTLAKYGKESENANTKLRIIEDKLENSVCKCCGADTNIDAAERVYLVNEAARLTTLIEDLNNKIADTQTRYTKAYSEYTEQYATYMEKLQDVDNSIMIAKAKNQIYDENQEQIDEMRGHLIVKQKEHDNVLFEISVIQAALKVLKSGDIQKDLLTTFVAVLNLHLAHFTQYVNIDYIVIRAVANKASVSIFLNIPCYFLIQVKYKLNIFRRETFRIITTHEGKISL